MHSFILIPVFSLLVGVSVYASVRFGIPAGESWYKNVVDKAEGNFRRAFSELFLLDLSPRVFAHLSVLRIPLAGIVAYAITFSLPFTICMAVVAYFASGWIIRFLKKRRMQRFDEQLVDVLSVLASSVRAGLSLAQALEAAALKMPPPACQEFGLLVKEFQYGTSIEHVLMNARQRLGRNFSIVATALIVNREKGGNLGEVLDKISASLREITRLEKKINTETASVRFSAKLMALMPLAVGVIFYFIEPSSMELLFTDVVGSIILFLVVALNVGAMFIIQRIVSAEI